MPYLQPGKRHAIYYRDINPGGKTPVVFCHGSGGNHRHWNLQVKRLENSTRPVSLDLPGHGNSTGNPMEKIEDYREVIREFVNELSLPPFFLAGHSMGGAIALDYARLYPGKLLGIILAGTGARLRVDPALLETFRQGEINPELTGLLYSRNAPSSLLEQSKKELEQTPPHLFAADFTACDNFDLMHELRQIEVPALIISAEEDQFTPVKYGKYLHENLKHSQFTVIPGAGHMMMLEKFEEVSRAIEQFISGTAGHVNYQQ